MEDTMPPRPIEELDKTLAEVVAERQKFRDALLDPNLTAEQRRIAIVNIQSRTQRIEHLLNERSQATFKQQIDAL